jgi:hypothetical protein
MKDDLAYVPMEGSVAGFGDDLSAEEQAYQQVQRTAAAQFVVASVGVVGVFLGANTTNKTKKHSRPRPAHGAGGGPGRPRDSRPLGFRPCVC